MAGYWERDLAGDLIQPQLWSQAAGEVSLRVELSARREVFEDWAPTFKSHWTNEGCEVVKAVEVQGKTWPGR